MVFIVKMMEPYAKALAIIRSESSETPMEDFEPNYQWCFRDVESRNDEDGPQAPVGPTSYRDMVFGAILQ